MLAISSGAAENTSTNIEALAAQILAQLEQNAPKTPEAFRTNILKEASTPVWNIAPESLSLTAIRGNEGQAYAIYRYQFQVPWAGTNDSDPAVSKTPHRLSISFSNGVTCSFYDFEKNPDARVAISTNELIRQIRVLASPKREDSIGYEFWKHVFTTTTEDMKAKTTFDAVYRDYATLTFKTMYWPIHADHAYSFSTPSVRGFQFGDPQTKQTCVLEVFDHDDTHITVLFKVHKNAMVRLTQKDVNLFISTLKILPETEDQKSNKTLDDTSQ